MLPPLSKTANSSVLDQSMAANKSSICSVRYTSMSTVFGARKPFKSVLSDTLFWFSPTQIFKESSWRDGKVMDERKSKRLDSCRRWSDSFDTLFKVIGGHRHWP